MRNVITIMNKELKSIFVSPIAYVVVCLFLILSAILFLIFTLRPGAPAEMRVLFAGLVWVLIPVLPAVGMRLIAEEHRSGTIESPCPPNTIAEISFTETFSSIAIKARRRAVSRIPAIPKTRV